MKSRVPSHESRAGRSIGPSSTDRPATRDPRPETSAAAPSGSPNRAVYDAAYYAQMYHRHWFMCPERKWREREANLLELVEPRGTEILLDLGCARGDTALFFAPHVGRVIGVDGEPLAVELARQRARELGVGNAEFLLADAGHFPEMADGSIDVVGAFDFLEHVTDDTLRRMLSEVRRVLKPGGRFAAYTPNREHLVERLKARNFILRQQPDHIAVRRLREIARFLEEAGLRVEKVFYPASPYPLWRYVDLALKEIPFLGRPFRFRVCLRAVKD